MSGAVTWEGRAITEHQTMNTVIHAAFRRDLGRFLAALSTFPPGDRARAAGLGRAWDNFRDMLHQHHQDEETIFFPVLAKLGADQGLIHDLESEHGVMSNALVEADVAMRRFTSDSTAESAAAAHRAMLTLQEALGIHLAHEERDLEPFSAGHVGTPEMKAAQKDVRKAFKGNAGTFFAWLLDGADADAQAKVRSQIPAPVLFALTKVAGRKYNKEVAPVWASPG